MTRASIAFLFAAVVLGTAACQDETLTLSQGTNSSLSVRVYVDADGDGAFDAAADVAIGGANVTATGAGTELTGTSDASGLAVIDVAPGSYTLAVTGDIPAGAVLGTASSPVIVAPFQGATLTTEFRYSFNPGTLALTVYRDDDMSGTFDPAMDTPAAGVQARLLSGTDTVGSGATAADGTLLLTTIRPGAYSLAVDPFPTIEFTDTTQTVTIDAATETAVEVVFTGNLVASIGSITIADTGATVAIEGVVGWQKLSPPNVAFPFSTRLDAAMQDGTGAVWLFDFGVDPSPLVIGDNIRVIGTVSVFRGKLQIAPDTVSNIEILGNVGEPSTSVATAAEINAGSFQGQLVIIDGTVDSVFVLSFGNQEVFLTDGAGDTFTVFADSRTDVLDTLWTVGQLYAVTGVPGADDRGFSPGATFPFRLEVRGQSDVVLGGSSVTMAAARGMDGQVVTVEGILTWQQEFQTRLEAYIQDGTAGMALFDFGVDPTGLLRGDRIRIRGEVGAFRGEVQIGSVEVLSVVGNEAVPAARSVTAAEINAPMFEAELVTINGTVDSVNVLSFGNQDVFLTDGDGDTFLVFVDARTGITDATWTVGVAYDVTGVLTFDDRNTDLPARLEPRDPGDVQ